MTVDETSSFGFGLNDVQLGRLLSNFDVYAQAIESAGNRQSLETLSQHIQEISSLPYLGRLIETNAGNQLCGIYERHPWVKDLLVNEIKSLFDRPSWEYSVLAMRLIGQTDVGHPTSLAMAMVEDLGKDYLASGLGKMLEPWRLENGTTVERLMKNQSARKDIAAYWRVLTQGRTEDPATSRWKNLSSALRSLHKFPEIEEIIETINDDSLDFISSHLTDHPAGMAAIRRVRLAKITRGEQGKPIRPRHF